MTFAAIRRMIFCLLCLTAMRGPAADEKEQPDDAAALNARVVQLYQQGKFADLSAVVPIASAPARPRPGGRRIRTKAEAIPFAKKVLELSEKALGPEHPDTATSLNNPAALCMMDLHSSCGSRL